MKIIHFYYCLAFLVSAVLTKGSNPHPDVKILFKRSDFPDYFNFNDEYSAEVGIQWTEKPSMAKPDSLEFISLLAYKTLKKEMEKRTIELKRDEVKLINTLENFGSPKHKSGSKLTYLQKCEGYSKVLSPHQMNSVHFKGYFRMTTLTDVMNWTARILNETVTQLNNNKPLSLNPKRLWGLTDFIAKLTTYTNSVKIADKNLPKGQRMVVLQYSPLIDTKRLRDLAKKCKLWEIKYHLSKISFWPRLSIIIGSVFSNDYIISYVQQLQGSGNSDELLKRLNELDDIVRFGEMFDLYQKRAYLLGLFDGFKYFFEKENIPTLSIFE